LCSLSAACDVVDEKAMRTLTAAVDQALCPGTVIQIGGPYIDEETAKAKVSSVSWKYALAQRLACRYGRRDPVPVHDLSVCDIMSSPKKPLGRVESRLLVSNTCAVAERVLFRGDPEEEWDWESLLADCGFAPDRRATQRVCRRCVRRGLEPQFRVYCSLQWGVM